MSSASVNPQQQHPSVIQTSSSSVSVGVKRSLQHCPGSPVTCQLADAELWRRFHEVGNEMIVTKAGRRMFPVVAVLIGGLDPDALYSICVEFHPADDNRYKYVGGQWVIAAKSQLHDVPVPTYWHPEIPNFGSHWMNGLVSFGKLKLTNKDKLDKSQVSLVTLHLYQPTIRIIRVAGQNERFTVATFTFPETRFMAVTSYQNEDVTSLKVRFNPFAQKVFQDMAKGRSGGTGSSSNGQDDDDDDIDQLSPSCGDSAARALQQSQRQSSSVATKMMKGASGAIVTATMGSSYNNARNQPELSPHQGATASRQQQQQQSLLQLRPPVDNGVGHASGVQDVSFIGSGLTQPRYGGFSGAVDHFSGIDNSSFFAATSMYGNPYSYQSQQPQHQLSMTAPNVCFGNGQMPSSVGQTSPSAVAAAAAYASYSNMLFSSASAVPPPPLPPVAHTSIANSNGSLWPNLMYPSSTTAPFNASSSLSVLNKVSEAAVTSTTTSPSTPSGPNSTSNNRSGGNSSLTRIGVIVSNANHLATSSTSSTSTVSTPSLQSITNRTSSSSSADASSAPIAGNTSTGVLKASPPESGYCGSPPSEEWSACVYQQLGTTNRPTSNNQSSGPILTSLTSATNTNTY